MQRVIIATGVLLIALSVSCGDSEPKGAEQTDRHIPDTVIVVGPKETFDTLPHTDEVFELENLSESDTAFKALFDPENWSIAYDSEAFSVVSSKCETCWNNHDYAPFKVADTLLYVFMSEKGDTIATLISCFQKDLNAHNFNPKTLTAKGVFQKELVINKPGVVLDNWLKIGTPVSELAKRLGDPAFNNGIVIDYQRATDHIWFLAVGQKNGKVTSIRIGHYNS